MMMQLASTTVWQQSTFIGFLTSLLGAQSNRSDEINHEHYIPQSSKEYDTAIHELLISEEWRKFLLLYQMEY